MFVFQAIQALKLYQTTATRKALTDILENEQCFYKVRIEASLCLAKVRLIFFLLFIIYLQLNTPDTTFFDSKIQNLTTPLLT